jgi:hypothetical protein
MVGMWVSELNGEDPPTLNLDWGRNGRNKWKKEKLLGVCLILEQVCFLLLPSPMYIRLLIPQSLNTDLHNQLSRGL